MSESSIPSVLANICADKLQHIRRQKSRIPQFEIDQMAREVEPCRGFFNSIQKKTSSYENALIAEVKKASPSKGLIRADFNPAEIALAYENGGAACISVLTDVKYFQGCDENLSIVRGVSKLPLLRKDFMLDVYQIFESRALGADCILLIMAAITNSRAAELEDAAMSLGMDVLVEVHDADELQRALQLKSKLIGINNRNLKTMEVDIATTVKLSKMVPEGYIVICESGIETNDDIRNINKSGVYGFLVGESLMRHDDVYMATRKLLGS